MQWLNSFYHRVMLWWVALSVKDETDVKVIIGCVVLLAFFVFMGR